MESKTISKIRILDTNLLERKAKISPNVLTHARILSKTTAKYPLMRVSPYKVKTFTIHASVVGE